MRWLLVACAVVAGCHAASRGEAARGERDDDRVARRLDALFTPLHEHGSFSGAVVVGTRDRVLWQRGFGYANAERRAPFTVDTPGDAASVAKTFTAALVVQLAREGKLVLDAPVQQLLPELPYPAITLRHLLSHASGIPVLDYDFFDPFVPAPQIRTTERLLQVISERAPPLWFEPGTRFEYSSFGFDLAALAAARAAGKPFGRLLDEHFFGPLGMTSAFLRPGRLDAFPGVRTLGYRDGKLHDVFDFEEFAGGSNIYVSARDLHRWNLAWMTAPEPALLEPARISGSPSGISLGSWYGARDAHWYPGQLQAFHSVVFRDASTSIVYIANNTLEPWLHHALVRAVRAIVRGEDAKLTAPPSVVAIAKADHSALVGDWVASDGTSLHIATMPHLTLHQDGVAYRIVPAGKTALYVPGRDYMIGFAKDSHGEITRMYISTNVDERWATRSR